MSKKVAVLIKDKQRQYEGLRSSLGLLLNHHIVGMFVLNHEINLTEEYRDNMEFIDEMDGVRFSDVPENIDKYDFRPITLVDIPAKLKEYDLIIPY